MQKVVASTTASTDSLYPARESASSRSFHNRAQSSAPLGWHSRRFTTEIAQEASTRAHRVLRLLNNVFSEKQKLEFICDTRLSYRFAFEFKARIYTLSAQTISHASFQHPRESELRNRVKTF